MHRSWYKQNIKFPLFAHSLLFAVVGRGSCNEKNKSIAHFQKEWKTWSRVGARAVVGSFFFGGGGRTSLKTNARAPVPPQPNYPIIERAPNLAPDFPLFLKVGY